MKSLLTNIVRLALIGVALGLAGQPRAQSGYPNRPLRIVTPFAIGTSSDVNTRSLGAKLSEQLGQPVVIDGKPGAGGIPSILALTGAKPDGFTVLISAGNGILISKHLQPTAPFDPIADLAPISKTISQFLVLVVRADSSARNVEDLISQAKANPGKLNYSSGGIGSPTHLPCATFQTVAAIETTHIPFKGGGDNVKVLSMPAPGFTE